MTFNEINNQMNFKNDIFGWTNSGAHFGNYDNPEEAMYICGHHTLVASAKAVKIGKEINPDFKIGNMIAMVPIYPFSCRPADQVLAQQQMHNRFFFCDVQCRGHYPAYALKMFERKGFNIDITEEDKKALAEGTVDYIGFSYYMTNVVDSTVTKDIVFKVHLVIDFIESHPIFNFVFISFETYFCKFNKEINCFTVHKSTVFFS